MCTSSSFRQALRTIAVAIAACFLLGSVGQAQQLTPQQFQANPGQILKSNPNGGPQLTSLVRQLALADPTDLALIISLLANASPDQAAAIGAGLGQAALSVVRTNQPYATLIQQALSGANNSDASTAYAAVTGNLPIGAVGTGGGGSNGGVGGQTNALAAGGAGGTGGAEGIGAGGSPTGSFAFGGGVTSAGGVGGTTGASSTTVIVSVSPSR